MNKKHPAGVIYACTEKIPKILEKVLDFSERIDIIICVPSIEDLCNGSTPDSDSVCGGSNPSSSANKRCCLKMILWNHKRQRLFLCFWCNEAVEKNIKTRKNSALNLRGRVLPLKKCAVFVFDALCRLGYDQVCSQPAFLYFMV